MINAVQIQSDDSENSDNSAAAPSKKIPYDVKKLEDYIIQEIRTYLNLLISDNNNELESLLLINDAEDEDELYPSEQVGSFSLGNEARKPRRSSFSTDSWSREPQKSFSYSVPNQNIIGSRSSNRIKRIPSSRMVMYDENRPSGKLSLYNKPSSRVTGQSLMKENPYSKYGSTDDSEALIRNFDDRFRPQKEQVLFGNIGRTKLNEVIESNVNDGQTGKQRNEFLLSQNPQFKYGSVNSSLKPKQMKNEFFMPEGAETSLQSRIVSPKFVTWSEYEASKNGVPLNGIRNRNSNILMNENLERGGMSLQTPQYEKLDVDSDGRSMSTTSENNKSTTLPNLQFRLSDNNEAESNDAQPGQILSNESVLEKPQQKYVTGVNSQFPAGFENNDSTRQLGSTQNALPRENLFSYRIPPNYKFTEEIADERNPEISKIENVNDNQGIAKTRHGNDKNRTFKLVFINGNELPGKNLQKRTMGNSDKEFAASMLAGQNTYIPLTKDHTASNALGNLYSSNGKQQTGLFSTGYSNTFTHSRPDSLSALDSNYGVTNSSTSITPSFVTDRDLGLNGREIKSDQKSKIVKIIPMKIPS